MGPGLIACIDYAVALVAGDHALDDVTGDEDNSATKASDVKAIRREWISARMEYHAEHWGRFQEKFAAMYQMMADVCHNTPVDESVISQGM